MLRTVMGSACLLVSSIANAYTDVNPLTFSVFADSDYPYCCTVNSGNVFVYAAYSDYFARGMAEFNLSGPIAYRGEPVYLSFNYLSSSSQGSPYPTPFVAPISVSAYIGDNLAARPDYSVATLASLGIFQTAGLSFGDRITYDVTSIFQLATRSGAPALGFRLAMAAGTGGAPHSASFGNFALLPSVTAVPEPSAYALFIAGLGAVGWAVRCRQGQRSV
jgi:PEP-CTERM motif